MTEPETRILAMLGEQIQAAIDIAPVAIFVKDLERRYLLANRIAHEITGLEPGGLIGRTDTDIAPPESELLIREGDMRVIRNKEPCEREATVTVGGREKTFLTVRFPYLDAEGNLAGIIGVATDITAQREAERLQRDLATTREQTIEELRSSRQEAIERLARAIEGGDAETGRHLDQMDRISSYLGSQLGLDDEQITLLRAAAPMREVGHQILVGSESELLQMAARITLTHHEWFDGNGHPRGLSGEEIPIEGRIVAVADAFNALLGDRPNRQAMSVDEAVEVIRNGRGTQFDPEVVDALLEHLDDVLELRG